MKTLPRSNAWHLAAYALAVASLAPATALAAPQYRIEPVPSGDDVVPISAAGVNQKGEVVGQALVKNGRATAAYAYRGGVTTQVGLPGDEAVSINRRADVAGDASVNAAWWSSSGALHNLGAKMSCQGSSHAVGMNDDRLLAGWTSCWGGDAHAFVSQGGVVTDLPTLGGIGADARGVNNAGQVIGVAATDRNGQFGPHFHAFRWESGAITDLGTFGGDQSDAWAISSNGHVVGSAQDASGAWLPYRHDGSQMRRLPDCRDQYTMPRGINAKDEVIGLFGDGRKKTAFLMRKARCYPLANLLGDSGTDWEIDGVSAINDAGLIVGHGHYRGEERAFIATPVAP